MATPRTRLRALVIAVAAAALAGSFSAPAHAAPSTGEIDKKIEAASNQLEDVTESYNKLRIDLAKTKSDEVALAKSLAPAKAKLATATSKVDTIASTSYKQGRLGPMTALLGADTGSLMDRMGYLEQINRSNQQDITTYTETTRDYDKRQAALKVLQAKQTAQIKEVSAHKAKIEGDLKKLRAMRTAAYGQSKASASSGSAGSAPDIAGGAGSAVSFAYKQANKPAYYGYGDEGPSTFDCSGLTMKAWQAGGKSLPHNAAAQYRATSRISRSELKPGDLVFYRQLAHVGLYVGDGMIIDASREGEPVKKRTIDIMTPYAYGRV